MKALVRILGCFFVGIVMVSIFFIGYFLAKSEADQPLEKQGFYFAKNPSEMQAVYEACDAYLKCSSIEIPPDNFVVIYRDTKKEFKDREEAERPKYYQE